MENLDSDFAVLKIDRNLRERKTWEKDTFMCICALVSFKSLQDNHPFVCWYFKNVRFRK